jgi:hypothetical protein
MKKIVKLTESDLVNIVKKVLSEQVNNTLTLNPKNLKFGDKGNDVRVLQQKLMDMGLLKTKSGKTTGYFGNLTNAGLARALGKPIPKKIITSKTKKLGDKSQIDNKSVKTKTLSQSIEASSNVPDITGSERINKELAYINARPKFKGKPFFIVDPKLNIVYAFDENHKFIAYSQSISGADKQTEKIVTYEEWCNISGLKWDKFAKRCKGQTVRSAAESLKLKSVDPNYKILEKLHKRYQAPGIYQTSTARYEKGYTGEKGVANLFPLETPEGVILPTAIHSLVPIANRITADAELKKYLNSEKNAGRIPKEYLDVVTDLTSKYDLSSGCFNVDPKFANNPKVIAIAKKKAYVFIMSEKNKNYLVSVPPEKQDDFFLGVKGDGKLCRPIESVAANFASTEEKTSIA